MYRVIVKFVPEEDSFVLDLRFDTSTGKRVGKYYACATCGRLFATKKSAEKALEKYLAEVKSYTNPKLWSNIYPELQERKLWVIEEVL